MNSDDTILRGTFKKFIRPPVNEPRVLTKSRIKRTSSEPSVDLSYITSKVLQKFHPERTDLPGFRETLNRMKNSFEPSSKEKTQLEIEVAITNSTITELLKENKLLKKQNRQIQQRLAQSKKNDKKSMNRYRDENKKEKLMQLERQNASLRAEIKDLKRELNELSKQETTMSSNLESDSICSNSSLNGMNFNPYEMLHIKQKQITHLRDLVKKLEIQVDFINRKSFTEAENVKKSLESMVKDLKQKLDKSWDIHSELKDKNFELICENKALKEKLSLYRKNDLTDNSPTRATALSRTDTMLSLSSEGDLDLKFDF